MSDDGSKKIVLARRARFIAAAVASVGIACGKENKEPPMPCLSVAYIPPDAEPMPCLSPPPMDTNDAAPTDAGAPDADAGKPTTKVRTTQPTAAPLPCLSPRIPEQKK
jgi:hypothetical protein